MIDEQKLRELAHQCICHPVSRSITEVEEAGAAIIELLDRVNALEGIEQEHRALLVNEQNLREELVALRAAMALAASAIQQKPLTDEQKQEIHDETGAGHALICLVEAAATAPLLEHIEELEKDRDYCEQSWNEAMATHENIASLKEQIAALTAQLEEADKDAARYRWMQETFTSDDAWPDDVADAKTATQLDAAIDAAMKETP